MNTYMIPALFFGQIGGVLIGVTLAIPDSDLCVALVGVAFVVLAIAIPCIAHGRRA